MVDVASEPQPILVAGRWVASGEQLVVVNPANDDVPAGVTYLADDDLYNEAVEGAVRAFAAGHGSPAYERGDLLRAISAGVTAHRERLAHLIALEIAKPIKDSLLEVDRTALAFRMAPTSRNGSWARSSRSTSSFIEGSISALPVASRSGRSRRSARSTCRSGCPYTSSRRRSPRVADRLQPPSKTPFACCAGRDHGAPARRRAR